MAESPRGAAGPPEDRPPVGVPLPVAGNGATVHPLPRVRSAMPSDAQAIVDLLSEVAMEQTLGIEASALRAADEAERLARLQPRAACACVAEVRGEVKGFAVAVRGGEAPLAHTATVSVAVAADARRRGLGAMLLHALASWAVGAGVEKLCGSVIDGNRGALALFLSAGYRVEGVRRMQVRVGDRLADEIVLGRTRWGEAVGAQGRLRHRGRRR